MKRYRTITAAGVSALLMLTACKESGNITPPDLSGNIEISGVISCGTLKAEADISRTDGVWTICYTSADSLNGMEIVINGTDCKVAHSGISFDYSSEQVPFVTAADYITTVIDNAQSAENISLSVSGEGKRITGAVLSSGYEIIIDKTGDITSVSAGDCKFTAVDNDKKEA